MTTITLVIQWFADPAHWNGPDGIPQRLVEHLQLSAESVAIGALIALPIGITLGHYGRFGNPSDPAFNYVTSPTAGISR